MVDGHGRRRAVERVTVTRLSAVVVAVLLVGLAAVSASIVPVTQTITSQGQEFIVNADRVAIKLDGETSTILQGQVIQFYNASGGPAGTVTLMGISGDAEDHEQFSDSSGELDTDLKSLKAGTYIANCTEGCDATTITVEEPYLKLKLKRNGKTIESIPAGSSFTIELSTNLDPNDGVTLAVEVPGGYIRGKNYDGTVFDTVNVDHLTDLVITTAGWELGTYTFQVLTEEEYAGGLDEESSEAELELVSGELKIAAQKTEVVELENLRLTVTGFPDLNFSLFVARNGEHAEFPASLNDNPSQITYGEFNDTIGADGEMVYIINFDRSGSYTITVKDVNSDAEDYIDIAVSKKKVTFTTPETCAIGSDLVITGTANTGKTLDIAIEDIIVKAGVAIDSKGAFEVKLPTPETSGTGTEDAIKIRGFIGGDFSENADVSEFNDDGSTLVLMVLGDLTAESSVALVPPGDSFTLSGTAQGSKLVDILTVGPDGGSGHGMNPLNSVENGLPSGMSYEVASVSSGTSTWTIDIAVDEDADTGQYLVFVLMSGQNQEYDGIDTDDLLQGLAAEYLGGDLSRLGAKTQEQIKAILLDATTETPGSDDYLKTVKITVGKAEVLLYALEDVVIGDNLTVHGASNREGQTIIIRVTGPLNLGTQFVTVADGAFSATFSTLEALTGDYTVEANDGEGHTDTKTVTIVTPIRTPEESSTTPAPTSASTTAMPSPASGAESGTTATAQPENSEPVPGFEALAVVIALVATSLLAVIARKRDD
ncbi:MAG: hypothetical protein JW945_07300 [Methanomicrobia archaeon]|nr:hypothetical protein [Methanomicrobia archaeon]